jgi:hypothetical protein
MASVFWVPIYILEFNHKWGSAQIYYPRQDNRKIKIGKTAPEMNISDVKKQR